MKKKILIIALVIIFFPVCISALSKNDNGSKSPETAGRIEATVTDLSGKPVPGGSLYIYLSDKSDFRGPAKYISEKSGNDGKTHIELSAGSYFIIARRRINEEDVGPLREGDLMGHFNSNPIKLKAGEVVKIKLKLGEIEGQMLLSPLSPTSTIKVEGTLEDSKKNPVSNAYTMVYNSKNINRRPDYMSLPSDGEGKFVVHISKPGKYFFTARTRYGAPPRQGELYGEYNQDGKGVEVKKNERITGIKIILRPFEIDLDK